MKVLPSQIIRDKRRQLGLTQADLGKLVGVSGITIHWWETKPERTRKLSYLTLRRLSQILDIDLQELAPAA